MYHKCITDSKDEIKISIQFSNLLFETKPGVDTVA